MLPHQLCRFVEGDPEEIAKLPWRYSGMLQTKDADGRLVGLFNSEHEFNYYREKYPKVIYKQIV